MIRTELDGVVEEHEIQTSELDGDLHVYMNEHENEIVQILQQAVNQHRCVDSGMKLLFCIFNVY